MKMYDKFVIIPNWLIYDKKGEINEMIKEDKIGNELVATAIWIYYNKTPYNEVGFTIRILMEKLGIDTMKKTNKEKWINIVETLIERKFITWVEKPEQLNIDSIIRVETNDDINFTFDEEGNKIDYCILSADKIRKILTLPYDRVIMLCMYVLGEIMVWKNSLDIKNIYDKNHKAETFYGSAEKLGGMINISRNCWEKYSKILDEEKIMINQSYYKGMKRNTIYGFDEEEIKQGLKYEKQEEVDIKENEINIKNTPIKKPLRGRIF